MSGIQFVSIEAENYWADINNKALISNFGNDVPRIKWCPANVEIHDGIATYVHKGVPDGNYDFVYLDGPELKEAASALDILKRKMYHDQLVVLIDGRDANSELLFRKLSAENKKWKKFTFKYPSNDTLIIHTANRCYVDFERDFAPVLIGY